MASDSRFHIAIAGEDQGHRLIAIYLADAAILARSEALRGWIEVENLDSARVYRGLTEADPYYRHSALQADHDARFGKRWFSIPRIDDEPAGNAWWFVQLYQIMATQERRPDALIALRDSDGDAALATHVERALRHIERLPSSFPVVFGLPHETVEGWYIAIGDFPPERMSQANRDLSFDPSAEPHRLTHAAKQNSRNAKRVLHYLVGDAGSLREAPASTPKAEVLHGVLSSASPDRAAQAKHCGLSTFAALLWDHLAQAVVPGPT
jgi:hypothetical protein